MGIILALDEPVSTFVAISAPWLNGQWLVEVVLVPLLLVGLFQNSLNSLRGIEGPEYQCFQ